MRCLLVAVVLLLPGALIADSPRFKVAIEDGPTVWTRRSYLLEACSDSLVIHSHGGFNFGLQYGSRLLTMGQSDGFTLGVRRNGKTVNLVGGKVVSAAKPYRTGRTKIGELSEGQSYTKQINELEIKQMAEVVTGYPAERAPDGQILYKDTCLCTYEITNLADEEVLVEPRVTVICRLALDPRLQFYSPRTMPEKLLGGVVLDTLPRYLLCLENPSIKKPGKTSVLTLRFDDRRIGPAKAVLTNTSALTFDWEIKATSTMPPFGGFTYSAAVFYWTPRTLAPGQKVTIALGYGLGKAQCPETSGNMDIHLTGNFAPGQRFNIVADVPEPLNGQTLKLELPPGITLTEGREVQPLSIGEGPAHTLWKARVERPGEYPIRVHSSHGLMLTKILKVSK